MHLILFTQMGIIKNKQMPKYHVKLEIICCNITILCKLLKCTPWAKYMMIAHSQIPSPGVIYEGLKTKLLSVHTNSTQQGINTIFEFLM